MAASDRGGAYAVTSRTLRLFLQSMMLGLGAWLAIRGEVTPGIMIAASILLGRALAPIDQAVGQWPVLQGALRGRRSLVKLLHETPEEPVRTPLPDPKAVLEAANLVVGAPGAEVPAVKGVSFRLEAGPGGRHRRAVGLGQVDPGPGAGGCVAAASRGKVSLGGAALDQYGEEALARHIGWLPQEVVLFEGTVAENIARLDPEPDPDAVVEAAMRAGAHEMILALPGGYDFPGCGGWRRAVGRAAPADRAGARVPWRSGSSCNSRRTGCASGHGRGRGGAQPGDCRDLKSQAAVRR